MFVLHLEAQKGMRKAWQIRRIQKVIKSDTHVGVWNWVNLLFNKGIVKSGEFGASFRYGFEEGSNTRRDLWCRFRKGYTPPGIHLEQVVFCISGADFEEGIPRLISIWSTQCFMFLVWISRGVYPAWNKLRAYGRYGFRGGYAPREIHVEHICLYTAGMDFEEGIPRLKSIWTYLFLYRWYGFRGGYTPPEIHIWGVAWHHQGLARMQKKRSLPSPKRATLCRQRRRFLPPKNNRNRS